MIPEVCLLCHAPSQHHGLCAGCRQDLPWLTEPHCPVCALPSPANQVCGQCITHPPAFTAAFAAFRFEYPLVGVIHRFKYQGDWRLGSTLAKWLAQGLQVQTSLDYKPDLVIPIPLHTSRLKERGFNQAQLLAEQWAVDNKIPLAKFLLQRIVPTGSQAALDKEERLRNLHDAFLSNPEVMNKHILLIDDVMTTGATLEQASRELLRSGAKRVDVACLARAGKK